MTLIRTLTWLPPAFALGVVMGFPVAACSGSRATSVGAVASEPPHALGVVALGESHESGSPRSTSFASADFIPEAPPTPACTVAIDGCTVPRVAACAEGCATGQVCVLSPTCASVCEAPCTRSCEAGEECVVSPSGASECRAPEPFNAGALDFVGTTAPLSLTPPYAFVAEGSGAPFAAGASLQVRGAGPDGAGFAPFQETFTATTFMRTSPPLSSLAATDVWGTGSIPVGWAPGSDEVTVSVIGPKGMAQCPANDAAGHFDVPRGVVDAVLGSGAPTMTLSVTRARVEVRKGEGTRGAMASAVPPPVGYLELETSSTESFSFEGRAGE